MRPLQNKFYHGGGWCKFGSVDLPDFRPSTVLGSTLVISVELKRVESSIAMLKKLELAQICFQVQAGLSIPTLFEGVLARWYATPLLRCLPGFKSRQFHFFQWFV